MTVSSYSYPITVTNGVPQPFKVNSPWQPSTAQAVRISNNSPWVAQVSGVNNAPTDVYTLSPGAIDVFRFTGADGPIRFQFPSPTVTGSGSMQVEFSDVGGVDFAGSYPASMNQTTVNLASGTTVDITGPVTVEQGTATNLQVGTSQVLQATLSNVTEGDYTVGVPFPPWATRLLAVTNANTLSPTGTPMLCTVIGNTTGARYGRKVLTATPAPATNASMHLEGCSIAEYPILPGVDGQYVLSFFPLSSGGSDPTVNVFAAALVTPLFEPSTQVVQVGVDGSSAVLGPQSSSQILEVMALSISSAVGSTPGNADIQINDPGGTLGSGRTILRPQQAASSTAQTTLTGRFFLDQGQFLSVVSRASDLYVSGTALYKVWSN